MQPDIPNGLAPHDPRSSKSHFGGTVVGNGHVETSGKASEGATSEPVSVTAYDRRVQEFKALVRRYILQLRYGCTSPECVTPHCFSGKKRFARTPVRRPNPYTARLQAYALATRSDPYAALCPHPPTVQAREILPTDGEEALNLYVDAKERQNGLEWDGQKQATYEPAGTLYRRRATGTKGSGPFLCYEVFQRAGSSGDETDESPKVDLKSIPVLSTWSAFHVSLHDKKDFKSLTQCLFDTFALKRFEKSNVQSVRRHNVYAHQSGEQFTIRRCSNRSYTSNPDDALSLIEEIGPGIHDLETGEPDTFGASSEFFHCGTPGSLEYLFNILGPLFTPPPSKLASDSADTATSSQSNDDTYVSDEKAFSTIMQCLLILPNCTFGGRNYTLRRTKWANISTNGTDLECYKEDHHHDFGSELVLRLVDRLVRAIAARRCHFEMMNTLHSSQTATDSWSQISRFPLADRLIKSLPVMEKSYFKLDADPDPSWSFTGLVTDFLEALMLHKWNSDTVVNRWTALGGAMELLNEMYLAQDRLGLRFEAHPIKNMFEDPVAAQSLVHSFTKHQTNPNTRHVLSFPVLFVGDIVIPFRTINYAKMFAAYRSAGYLTHMSWQFNPTMNEERHSYLSSRLAISMAKFLILDVRREHMLEDALNQLRDRQKRELTKPLKVRVGQDEGEQGVDLGGVTQEFFRIVFQKAFDSDYGMFTTDPTTHLSWFRPLSPVPLYQWELLGLLISLAVFNGAIVPVNLPRCLYNRLLTGREPDTVEEIEDVWPDLASGLRQLQNWDPSNGDVVDVFAREYTFTINTPLTSVNITGHPHTIHTNALKSGDYIVDYDLRNWKQTLTDYVEDDTTMEQSSGNERSNSTDSSHSGMVTYENRLDFIKDYIRFLTVTSVEPQYQAFARGFHTCLDGSALSILTPKYLQLLVEGHHDLNIAALETTTRYVEGYSSEHPLILWFWEIVKSWSPDKQRSLLEFVTASDRVPMSGVSSVNFVIQRNGPDGDNLPTSTTCFGRLLIPEYENKEKLERKLNMALDLGTGFGNA